MASASHVLTGSCCYTGCTEGSAPCRNLHLQVVVHGVTADLPDRILHMQHGMFGESRRADAQQGVKIKQLPIASHPTGDQQDDPDDTKNKAGLYLFVHS